MAAWRAGLQAECSPHSGKACESSGILSACAHRQWLCYPLCIALLGFAGSNPSRDAVELVDDEMSGPRNGIDRGRVRRRVAKINACELIHGAPKKRALAATSSRLEASPLPTTWKPRSFRERRGGHHFDHEGSLRERREVCPVRPRQPFRFQDPVPLPASPSAGAAQGKIKRPAQAGRRNSREVRRTARNVVRDRSSVLIGSGAQRHEKWRPGNGVNVVVDHTISTRVYIGIACPAVAVDENAAFGSAGNAGLRASSSLGSTPTPMTTRSAGRVRLSVLTEVTFPLPSRAITFSPSASSTPFCGYAWRQGKPFPGPGTGALSDRTTQPW